MAKKKSKLKKILKTVAPLAIAGLGAAALGRRRNRNAMINAADANEGFLDSMIPTGPFIMKKNKPVMMTPQDMANDPMFLDAMAAKGGRIMKTKKGGRAVRKANRSKKK